jgi:hypothetical protein
MLKLLVAAINSLLEFARKHAGPRLDPSALLTRDEEAELINLDTAFHAHCQLSGLTLSVIPEREDVCLRRFGNSRLPYALCTMHLPIKDEPGKMSRELVGSGMMILPTPEWKHALKSLRATAALKANVEESAKTASTSTLTATSEDPGVSLDRHEDDHGTGRKNEKPKRGRPAGGKTSKRDRKLYLDWKTAYESNRITKAEFLRVKGLPESDLAAIERGRKQRD